MAVEKKIFPSARDDAGSAERRVSTPQTESPSYALAYQDGEFLCRDELRPVRLQLELIKPEILQREHNIHSTIVVFGSARLPEPESARADLEEAREMAEADPDDPLLASRLARAERAWDNSRYYDEARKFAALVSERCQDEKHATMVITTGGGGGIMEAANRGAHDVGAKSIGLNIVLPHEQKPNRYITPELCFQFHYFAIRKMHFLIRAQALVIFPGGFGTLDEFFDAITLIQTGKMDPIPILLFGKPFWYKVLNIDVLEEEGMISPKDKELIVHVDTAEEACEYLAQKCGMPTGKKADKKAK